jgi:putative holin Dp-1
VSNPLPADSFVIPPKLYDFLKYVALVILPAVSALILGLGVTLNWTPATVTAGVITLIDTFLGAVLGKSASNYKQQEPMVFGDIIVQQDIDGLPMGLRFVGYHENFVFQDQSQVLLNVKREQQLG